METDRRRPDPFPDRTSLPIDPPFIDFDLEPATLEDDPAFMQLLRTMESQSDAMREQLESMREQSEASRRAQRSAFWFSIASLAVAALSLAVAAIALLHDFGSIG